MSNNKYSEVRMLLTNYLGMGEYASDSKFIDRLIISSVKEDELMDSVKEIVYDPERYKYNKSTIAEYDSIGKKVYVNLVLLKSLTKVMNKNYKAEMNPLERLYYINLVVSQYFYHEIVHANQYGKAHDKSDNSFDAFLVRTCLFQPVEKSDKTIDHETIGEKMYRMYQENYSFSFCERTAEINSFKTILGFLDEYKMNMPHAYQLLQKELMSRYILGYEEAFEKGMCPLEAYFYGTNRPEIWRNLDVHRNNKNEMFKVVSAKYPLLDRCYYGLPISKDEYEDIKGRAGLK